MPKSHPTWVCGLKLQQLANEKSDLTVTPYVGVWIETTTYDQLLECIHSHTLRGCVD